MPGEKRYYVYILASISRVLYKTGETDSFTRRYRVHRLVHYETFRYVNNAIARETEIKKWRRERKSRSLSSRIQFGKIWQPTGENPP